MSAQGKPGYFFGHTDEPQTCEVCGEPWTSSSVLEDFADGKQRPSCAECAMRFDFWSAAYNRFRDALRLRNVGGK